MNLTMYNRIHALYGQHIFKRSVLSIRQGAGGIEWAMAGKGYRTAVEIGTYRGVGAAEMSQYCERVVTIDLHHGRMEQLEETHDRHAFWRSLGVENVELALVADDRQKARLLKNLAFDFAFIDGAHGPNIAADFALVRRCGHVLFHDYDRRGARELDHVADFIDSLPRHEVQTRDIFALWTAA